MQVNNALISIVRRTLLSLHTHLLHCVSTHGHDITALCVLPISFHESISTTRVNDARVVLWRYVSNQVEGTTVIICPRGAFFFH